jgi:hypothetical protein
MDVQADYVFVPAGSKAERINNQYKISVNGGYNLLGLLWKKITKKMNDGLSGLIASGYMSFILLFIK